MCGRSCFCLLATWLVIAPVFLCGQSDESRPAHDLARAILASPEAPDPASNLHHRIPVSPGTTGLAGMTRAAGMIFSGTVTAIARRPATSGQAIETVAITFRVEQAIRGTTAGDSLTITQWVGLWASGQRYRVGERVLLFLYRPSKLGLTSTVGGPVGRFDVDAAGRVLLSARQLSAFRTDPVLGGKSRVSFSDFAWAVRQAGEEE